VDRVKEPSAHGAAARPPGSGIAMREVVGVMDGFEQTRVGTSESTVSVEVAARMLGIGRTLAYRLAAADELPVPVIRIGRKLRIPAEPLRALLGLKADAGGEPAGGRGPVEHLDETG
jgi:excisionase family DNA binding protein